jgi:outer membrane protein
MRDLHRGGAGSGGAGAAVALMALALVLGAAPLAAVEGKIAVVDMQRALNECDAGKRAKDQVKAKFERSQNQLKKQREELDRLKEDYDRKASVLKEEERRNLEKDLESRGLEFKRKYEDFQRDLKETDAELTKSIVEELYELVRDYGEKHGYTLVLEASSGALLYNDKAVDVTDEIVKLHNASPHKEASKRSSSKE